MQIQNLHLWTIDFQVLNIWIKCTLFQDQTQFEGSHDCEALTFVCQNLMKKLKKKWWIRFCVRYSVPIQPNLTSPLGRPQWQIFPLLKMTLVVNWLRWLPNINKRFRVRMRVQVCASKQPFSTIYHLKSLPGHSDQHSPNSVFHTPTKSELGRFRQFEASWKAVVFGRWLIVAGVRPIFLVGRAGRHNPPITQPYKGQPL